jgi:hypothetical protein
MLRCIWLGSILVTPMFRPLRYVFFRILEWKLHDTQENTPLLVASLGTFVLLCSNAILVTMLVNGFMGRPLIPRVSMERNVSYVLLAAAAIIFTRLTSKAWVENGRYQQLLREFAKTTDHHERVRTVLFWSYVLSSIVVPIALSIFWPRHS